MCLTTKNVGLQYFMKKEDKSLLDVENGEATVTTFTKKPPPNVISAIFCYFFM